MASIVLLIAGGFDNRMEQNFNFFRLCTRMYMQ